MKHYEQKKIHTNAENGLVSGKRRPLWAGRVSNRIHQQIEKKKQRDLQRLKETRKNLKKVEIFIDRTYSLCYVLFIEIKAGRFE